MFVAHLDGIDQSTWGPTLVDVMQDVPRLVVDYFASLEKLGQLKATLDRLGAVVDGSKVKVTVHVEVSADALPLHPAGASTAVESQVDVPIAA